jgi:hypothetical protein
LNESDQRRLVGDRFSIDELEQLCADFSERLRAAGRTEQVDRDALGRDRGEPSLILALFEWCRRRNVLPLLLEEISKVRPGIFEEAPAAAAAAVPIPVPPIAPITADLPPSAAAVIAPAEPPGPEPDRGPRPEPGPMYAFVTGSGLGQAGALVIGSCVLLENPDRVRGQIRALVDDALHDPILRTNAAISALKRRTFDYATDDPEIRTRFIELLAVLSFEAYAYYAPAAVAGGATLAAVFEPLLADRMTNDRSRRFAIAVDRGLQDQQAALDDLVTKAVARLNREDPRGVAGAEVTQAAAGEPGISIAGYVAAILRKKLEGGTDLEQRAFERLHPQKIRLIHEIGSARFFSRRRPLR